MTTTHEPLLIDREEETFWDEKRRKSSLGYRMNLLARAQAKLRSAGEAELADGLDELHSEFWFWKNGMHRRHRVLLRGVPAALPREGRENALVPGPAVGHSPGHRLLRAP